MKRFVIRFAGFSSFADKTQQWSIRCELLNGAAAEDASSPMPQTASAICSHICGCYQALRKNKIQWYGCSPIFMDKWGQGYSRQLVTKLPNADILMQPAQIDKETLL
jgi:hypothetical protein